MPYTDVKITDLAQVNSIQKDDLFLVSHPLKDSTGTIQETPYTSNSISGGALSSTIKSALESDDLSVTGKWNFKTTAANFPTQNARFAIGDFLNALKTPSCLNSIVADGYDYGEHGWYHDLSTSIVQDKNKITVNNQSLSVMNNVIPNIDFVQRAIAGAYQNIISRLESAVQTITQTAINQNISFLPSHVGQIIISTTLKNNEYSSDGQTAAGFNLAHPENATNIRQFYGYGQTIDGIKYPNTQWIRHSGYVLMGADGSTSKPVSKANNTFTKGSNGFDGSNTATFTISKAAHSHTFTGNDHSKLDGKNIIHGEAEELNIHFLERLEAETLQVVQKVQVLKPVEQ